MKDMANTYRNMKTPALIELRSKKYVRLQKLESEHKGFFVKQEIDALKHQIHQIDVERTSRLLQRTLF
jgi:hypothetical protein